MTVEDPPTAWRDAVRAADLAARLAEAATAAVDQADTDGLALHELVSVVEAAAAASQRAAETARLCANRARERADLLRSGLPDARQAAADATAREALARDRYQEAAKHAFAQRQKES